MKLVLNYVLVVNYKVMKFHVILAMMKTENQKNSVQNARKNIIKTRIINVNNAQVNALNVSFLLMLFNAPPVKLRIKTHKNYVKNACQNFIKIRVENV